MILTFFTNKLDGIFSEYRHEYGDLYSKIDAINEKLSALEGKRSQYSPSGYKARVQALEDEKRGIGEQIRKISQDYSKSAAAIRLECEKAFHRKYGMSPERLDANAVTLINSGVMSDSDLMRMLDDFEGNATMQRLIGAKMSESQNETISARGKAVVEATTHTPHLDIIDSLVYLQSMALRTDENNGENITLETGRLISDEVATKLYPQRFAELSGAAEGITSD